jgi:mitogen-activated protein kinase 1/3
VDGKRILREVKMLHHFKHENIVSLADLVEPPPGHPFKDVYMVLEFMETDLHKIIYSKNQLTDDHVQYFMYQAVRALKYIHSAHVIHRDLKPSNLLLNGNCDLKICDFGLARGLDETVPSAHLTEYVVTRWYRAPEVMYSVQDYSFQIDVWALGCILAELLGKAPLWPGDDYIRQMNLIFDVLGTPTEEDMAVITNARALAYIRSLPPRPRVPWRQLFPNASELALDLLNQMLQFNPARRITVQQALEHPYFADLRNPESETVCDAVFDYSFEREGKTKEDLQRYMWDQIYYFRPWLKHVRGRGFTDDDDDRGKSRKNVPRSADQAMAAQLVNATVAEQKAAAAAAGAGDDSGEDDSSSQQIVGV